MSCIDGGPWDLFAHVTEMNRARLLGSEMGGLLPGEAVADLFCGAGGWGEGGKTLGVNVDFAINHWGQAIATHANNNPGCRHHLGDAWKARPREVIGPGTKLGLLLASAACTTHSRAKGSAPVSKRVHMLGWCIARWMEEVSPRLVMIENVPEWRDWGPLIAKRDEKGREVKDAQGRRVMVQDPARKGQHFRRWWRYCQRLGYVMEQRILDAPDYGEASRRRRLFIIARRDGLPICWPEVTHGNQADCGGHVHGGSGGRRDQGDERGPDEQRPAEAGVHRQAGRREMCRGLDGTLRPARGRKDHASGTGGELGSGLSPFRTAAECIDWSDLGWSIFDRKQDLKPKTQKRIAEGIRRYVIADPAPFVLRVSQPHDGKGGWHVWPTDRPLPTMTARQDVALCTPLVAQTCQTGANGAATPADEPLGTRQEWAVATPVLATTRNGEREGQRPRTHPVTDPLMTITGGAVQGVATPIIAPQNTGVYGQRPDAPGPTITQKGHQAVISPILAGAGGCSFAPARPDAPYHAVLPREDTGIATPVLMNNTTHHQGGRADGSMPTITTGGQGGLVAPVLAYMRHGGGQHSDPREPLHTPTAGGNHAGLVAPLLADYYGNSTTLHRPDQPLGAVTTLDRHAGVNVVLSGEWGAMIERGRKVAAWLVQHLGALVSIEAETGLAYVVMGGLRRYFVDILFRMLRPRELARAMGFPESYVWPKSQRDTTRLIGNAVSVRTAAALIGAVLPRGRGQREAVSA